MSDPAGFDARLRVMLITPEPGERADWLPRTQAALEGGIGCVHLRSKQSAGKALWHAAESLRELTQRFGALMLVNGRVDVALACGADGAHLGAAELPVAAARGLLGPRAILGFSAHAGDAPAAWHGADYCTFSPVYDSPGKGAAQGAAALGRFAAGAGVPVVALGGVAAGRVREVAAAGARGIAVIREIYDAHDPTAAARRLCAAWQES